MSDYVFFDVGANNGCSFLDYLKIDPNMTVFAFEPNPLMVPLINENSKNLRKFTFFNCAVSNFNGKAKFNIASSGYSYGASSLLELSDKAFTHWNGRTDMLYTDTVEVDVVRLDKIIQEHNLSTIDYLHVDTQGSDLNVLLGLGDYINIVKKGKIEAAAQLDILYKNQNSLQESVKFLEDAGFTILGITSNDYIESPNEVNIEFQRK